LVLARFFGDKKDGFFLDVGAHHQIRFSNTYKFYLYGWRGINIDATPGSMMEFNSIRPDDINLEIPISESNKDLTFYMFNESALNTFSESEARLKDGLRTFRIIETKELKSQRLENVLDKYLPCNTAIDFLSVDVEGFDLSVLRSNNWEKYRPEFVLAEDLNSDLENSLTSDLSTYMKHNGYKMAARTFNTLFFRLV
jgi:hypothetical protein